MAFIVADDKVEDFLKEKADKDKVKQIYKVAERFEKHHKPKPQTNADHVRSMSDEELAEWLTKITDDAQSDARTKCDYQWAEWLKSEVKE